MWGKCITLCPSGPRRGEPRLRIFIKCKFAHMLNNALTLGSSEHQRSREKINIERFQWYINLVQCWTGWLFDQEQVRGRGSNRWGQFRGLEGHLHVVDRGEIWVQSPIKMLVQADVDVLVDLHWPWAWKPPIVQAQTIPPHPQGFLASRCHLYSFWSCGCQDDSEESDRYSTLTERLMQEKNCRGLLQLAFFIDSDPEETYHMQQLGFL